MATKSLEEYRQFTTRAELDKAINMLRGIIMGINSGEAANEKEIAELTNWCSLHENLRTQHPFSELLPKVDTVLEDGEIDEDEREDLLWLCENFTGEGEYYDLISSKIQFLHGLVHGIMADGRLTNQEIRALQDWLLDQEDLKGTYPFDEIDALLTEILADQFITEDERASLMAFLSNFIEFKDSHNLVEADYEKLRRRYTISGICAADPEIKIAGRTFCFTGESATSSREDFADIVNSLGGVFRTGVSRKTDYLVVGSLGNPCWAFSCYGRKVEAAMEIRRNGGKVQIIKEADFWDAVHDIRGD